MDSLCSIVYILLIKKKEVPIMLKKLTAFLLSLLLCLSLFPGQACAAGQPEPPEPPAAEEPLEPETPDEPVAPMAEEMPEDGIGPHTSN